MAEAVVLGDMHHAATAALEIATEESRGLEDVDPFDVAHRLRFYWAQCEPARPDAPLVDVERAFTALLAAEEHGLIVDA